MGLNSGIGEAEKSSPRWNQTLLGIMLPPMPDTGFRASALPPVPAASVAIAHWQEHALEAVNPLTGRAMDDVVYVPYGRYRRPRAGLQAGAGGRL